MALKAVSAPLGSPVGGSGSVNTIPLWTSGSTLSNSAVTQNASGSVGIGGVAALATNTVDVSTAGWGIRLPATPGATGAGTEQTLDCYAEVPWTPTDASGAGLVLTINRARYTKIGGIVIATIDMVYPATASSAAAKINLPESTSTLNIGAVTVGYCSNAATGITGIVVNGRIDLYYGSPSAQVLNSTLSGARVVMSACFIV